jgi:hypothetical protein
MMRRLVSQRPATTSAALERARTFHLMLLAVIAIYIVVAETIAWGFEDSEPLPFAERDASWLPLVRLLLFILAGIQYALALLVFGRPWLWRHVLSATALRDPAKVPPALFSLHVAAVVPFVGAATFAMLLFFLSSRRIDLYPLLALSAAGMAAYWPQNRQWARLLSGIPGWQSAAS